MSIRFEVVRTDAKQPWHARIRYGNNEPGWVTENYTEKASAVHAINVLAKEFGTPAIRMAMEYREVDERTTHG